MAVLITCGATPLGLEVAQEFANNSIPFEILDDLDGFDLSKLQGKPYTHGLYSHAPTVRKVCHTYSIDTVVHLDLRIPDSESPFDSLRLILEAYDCGVDNFIYLSEDNPGPARKLVESAVLTRFPSKIILWPNGCLDKKVLATTIVEAYRSLLEPF
jgi:hypothetical protein